MGETEGLAAAAVRYAPPRAGHVDAGGGSGYDQVRRSIYLLYRRLSPEVVDTFRLSIPPGDVALHPSEDLRSGTRRVARTLAAHLGLLQTRIVTEFRPMPAGRAAMVTLGPECLVEIDAGFARRRRDIGAVLAHEVMHVLLLRRGLWSADEVLVDSAAAYLGIGWPLLNAAGRLGSLEPAAVGYALGKRAARFGGDPTPWLSSPSGRAAFTAGYARAADEPHRPPFRFTAPRRRRRYEKDRGRGRARCSGGYAFSGRCPREVIFACPTCNVHVTAPAGGRFVIRCDVCRTELDCVT